MTKEDIEKYKTEQSLRREQDLASLENAMAELEKKRLEDAAEYEKKELEGKLQTELDELKAQLKIFQKVCATQKTN